MNRKVLWTTLYTACEKIRNKANAFAKDAYHLWMGHEAEKQNTVACEQSTE